MKYLLLVMTLFMATITLAQETVTGKVTDAAGLPIPYVNIQLTGTNKGTISNKAGKYNLNVSSLFGTLKFSVLGYETQTVPLKNMLILDVTLLESSEQLDEVVLTALGLKRETKELKFYKGDYVISTNQSGIRYLLETLEPHAPDSFFNWNFFDTILQRKEYFSPYVWEDKAKELLARNPKFKIDFNLKKTYDSEFANNWYAQLNWLHQQSEHYEKSHLQYPVFRVR